MSFINLDLLNGCLRHCYSRFIHSGYNHSLWNDFIRRHFVNWYIDGRSDWLLCRISLNEENEIDGDRDCMVGLIEYIMCVCGMYNQIVRCRRIMNRQCSTLRRSD